MEGFLKLGELKQLLIHCLSLIHWSLIENGLRLHKNFNKFYVFQMYYMQPEAAACDCGWITNHSFRGGSFPLIMNINLIRRVNWNNLEGYPEFLGWIQGYLSSFFRSFLSFFSYISYIFPSCWFAHIIWNLRLDRKMVF